MLPLLLLVMAINPISADEAIAEVSLERTPCFGTCPVDKIILRSDGTAEYTGTEYVTRKGSYRGKIDKEAFEKLAKLVAEKKFFDLNERYSRPITDHATLITTVKRGKSAKKVSNYANAAPKELQEIEKKIIELIEKIEWTKAG